jgi:hypothetical protein
MSSAGSTIDRALRGPARILAARFPDRRVLAPILADVVVFGLFLTAGALAVFFHKHAADFLNDDVSYFERARSLLRYGFDGFNGQLETTQPSGLPIVLASMCYAGGCSYAAILGAMVVFETLGFAATYLLFRRQIGRVVAAAICLALLASPVYFSLATQWVATTLPFFFTITSALLVSRKLEESTTTASRLGWGALLTVLATASLLIASAGFALLAAIVVKIAATYLSDKRLALVHMKTYAAVLLVGIAAQGLWMHRKPAPLEWPLPGYPHPYLQQLAVKSGPEPQLGYATWRDVAVRVKTNLQDETVLFVELFSSHWINRAWWSVVTTGPFFLILSGWAYSVWRAKGDCLQEWFFAGYQFIFLLWPWKMDVRYFLPVAPLACLYLWKGMQTVGILVKNRPRVLGIVWIPISTILAARSIIWLQNDRLVVHITESGLQQEVSFAAWLLSGIAAAWLVRKGSTWPAPLASLLQGHHQQIGPFHIDPRCGLKFACGLVIAGLAVAGFNNELEIGRQNRDLHSAVNRITPDVKAAMWIRAHTGTEAVIMARHVPITYYYADRKVVWFPPSSSAQLLMEGIQRHKIDYVVAVKRGISYFRPPDDVCVAELLAKYPSALRLIEQTPEFRIFQVIRSGSPESHLAANPNR